MNNTALAIALALTLSLAFAGCTTTTSPTPTDSNGTSSPSDSASASPTTTVPGPGMTSTPKGPAPVNLGAAAAYAILAKTGVSTTGTTKVVGDIGVSPIDATAITGFSLVMDASNQFSTSSLVTGQVRAANYAAPTPTQMTVAIANMEAAYTDAAGRTNPTATEVGAGNIGGRTMAPGLYKWGTGVTIPTDLVLAGGSNDVWIFQIAQGLELGTGAKIVLSGGAQPRNIFWQVADQATLASGSSFQGNILSHSATVLETGATLNGRALSQTAVTLDANAVTRAN